MATDSAEEIRQKLKELGDKRTAHDADGDKLSVEVEAALREAYGHISVTEAAKLLKMHRTTVYRVYEPHAL
jgi:transcriptional regulator of acetoin/glycerol metabolism